MRDAICLNCKNLLPETFNFCGHCGQKRSIHRLDVKHLAHDIIHYFTHADRSIFRLVVLLVKQPGRTVREYIEGSRKKYFPPVNFFLISVGLLAISAAVFKLFSLDFMRARGGVTRPFDPQDAGDQLMYFLTNRINWIYIGFIPVLTALFWMFYSRRKYNFIEHLVAGFYWNGFTILVLAFVIAPLVYLFNDLTAFYVLSILFLSLQTIYYSVGYYRMFEYHTIGKFIKSLSIAILVALISMLLFVVFLWVYYFFFPAGRR